MNVVRGLTERMREGNLKRWGKGEKITKSIVDEAIWKAIIL